MISLVGRMDKIEQLFGFFRRYKVSGEVCLELMSWTRRSIQARGPKPEQLFVKPEARKLFPGGRPKQPGKFPWCAARKPEQIFGLYPDIQAAAPRTRTFFAARLERSTQKRPNPKARPRKTRTFCTKPQA